MRSYKSDVFAIYLRISTNVSIILILTCIAISLLSTAESIAIPCSVKTYGRYLLPPLPSFEVTNCDLKESYSSFFSWNLKFSGNLSIFLFTAWLKVFVSTWYKIAKSLSSITCFPLITYIRLWIWLTSITLSFTSEFTSINSLLSFAIESSNPFLKSQIATSSLQSVYSFWGHKLWPQTVSSCSFLFCFPNCCSYIIWYFFNRGIYSGGFLRPASHSSTV